MWDQNQNRVDDRIEAVEVGGLSAAHVHNDPAQKLILFVDGTSVPFKYGVYVGYTHMPTDADVAALNATGATLSWRPRSIQYLRAQATFAQIQALAALPGVTRVEAWQVMYALNDNATRTFRARASDGGVGAAMFPSVWANLGYTGKGVVVGILDTGVNDAAAAPSYPGHESLRGKFVGGGDFSNADASLNTPPDSSANPANAVDPTGDYHGTHVAGTAIGSGGPTGLLSGAEPGRYAGMAPDARLVDCKVLTDAGEGGGAAEALDWCIAHVNTTWSATSPDAVYKGIQVINMSIGGATASDGTDADCVAVNAAVKAGIVVCVATGNDGNTGYMPSPAAADDDVAVGALTDANTLQHGDDVVADYSNEGPRMSDGDADHVDEMKPAVCGSGSDIISALGDPSTNGTLYHNINGTSMATPTITGLCALIRQANPALTAAEVRAVLENTAEHRTDHGKQPPSAADPFGVDPNYHPSWGWGEPDAYAAVKEALNPATTQVIAEGTSSVANVGGHLQVGITWTTQREIGVTGFEVWRAADFGGSPGTFAVASPVVHAQGHGVIERSTNRTSYAWTDLDPALVVGTPYWYEVRWTDAQGYGHTEPAFRVRTDVPPVRARVQWAITHNALDNDIAARFGSGTDPLHPAFVRPCGGTGAADSSVVVVPVGFGSMTRWFFHADLTDRDLVAGYLPPSAANPWFLSVQEEGFVNTEGIVDSFSVTTYNGATATTLRTPSPSTPTAEKQTTTFWIPLDPATSLNHTPVFDAVGDQNTSEGLALAFTVHATDPDGQALTYGASGLPLGAAFNTGTHAFSWTPATGQAGTYHLRFTATDTQLAADTELVNVTVAPRAPGSNTAPVLAPVPDKSTQENVQLAFQVTAHDQEGGTLTYSAAFLPNGATFDGPTRTFTWTPAFGDLGEYRVRFFVGDQGGLTDSETVAITVTNGRFAPVLSCTPDTTLFSGTVGADVQGAQNVFALAPFTIGPNVGQVQGSLSWTGGPAIDLDLYLLDPSGNQVSSGATATNDPEVATYATPAPGTYQWKVVAFDNPNPNEAWTVTSVRCTQPAVGVEPRAGRLALALEQNQPNPFTRSASIRFALPMDGKVSLEIYNVTGRLIRTLARGPLAAGWYQRVWDGRTDGGATASPGVYFYRLETAQGVRSRKMILLQ